MRKSGTHQADLELAHRVLRGEQAGFDDFFSRYYPRVFRYCKRRVNETDAEDLAVETLRQALRRIETYRGEAALLTWVCQIARRQVGAFYRQEARHRQTFSIDDDLHIIAEVEAMAVELIDTQESALEQSRRTTLVHQMLDYLPGEYGQVLEWKYMDGFSVEEIAERLSTTQIAVQSMLARARKAFKARYQDIQDALAAGDTQALVTGRKTS